MGNKENTLRTYPIKSLTIFLAICFVVSVGAIVGMAFLHDELLIIRILVFIFCSVFAGASAIVLIQQLTCYIEVTEEHFIKHFLLTSTRIPYHKITRLVNDDGWYTVYVGEKKYASFATNTKEGQQIILFLEKKGLRIDW